MSNEQELLLDLIKIKIKYTDSEIKAVSSLLDKENFDPIILDVINVINKLAVSSKKNTNQKFYKKSSALDKMKNDDYDHYLNLINFQDKLLSRSIDLDTKTLQSLSNELGIANVKGRKRDQIIKLIVENLAKLKIEEANHFMEQELLVENPNNKFEMLADAILQRKKTKNSDSIE